MTPGKLRRGIARGGGLVDVAGAAAVLGITRQGVDWRWHSAARRGWVDFEQPIAFLRPGPTPSGPLWTREQMEAQREVDAARRIPEPE